MELVGNVKSFFFKIGTVLCRDGGGGVSVVTNEGVHAAGEEMG